MEAGVDAGPDAAPDATVPDASAPDASDVVAMDAALDATADATTPDVVDAAAPPDAIAPDDASDGGVPGDGGFVRYTETRIAPACDDLSTGATRLTDLDETDYDSTAITALPFAFQFFGRSHGFYSVSTNGFAQLWTSAVGTPTAIEATNTSAPIPTLAPPNNFIAPFWDDLLVDIVSQVRVATIGTAPNRRFVIEWRDVDDFSAGDVVALTFQARLFETTNVIEFHYCSMTATDPLNAGVIAGEFATVGLENDTGTAGAQHSHASAGSVSPANAIRFTP